MKYFLNVNGLISAKGPHLGKDPISILHMRRPGIQITPKVAATTDFKTYMIMEAHSFTTVCSYVSQMYMKQFAYLDEKEKYESGMLALLSKIEENSSDQLYEYFYNQQGVIQSAISDLQSKKALFANDPVMEMQFNFAVMKLKTINVLSKYPCLGGFQAGEDVSVLEANFNKCKAQNKINEPHLTMIAKYIASAKKKKQENVFVFTSLIQDALIVGGQNEEMKEIVEFMKPPYERIKRYDDFKADCDSVMDSQFIQALEADQY